MGVVVPPASGRARPLGAAPAAGRAKDSVELLLEGMAGPRPDRTKTMPQTAGEGSAAYHSEHAVRAGRTARDEEQKVLVDTVRLPIGIESEEPDGPVPPPDPTYVMPARLAPRVVVALMAGLLVVVALFAAFDRQAAAPGTAGARHDVAAAPAAQAPAAAPTSAPLAPRAAEPAAAQAPAPQAEPQPPAATDEPPSLPPPATASAARSHASGQRANPATSNAGHAGDIGEFKTTF